jgi:hypothetical protein
MKRFVFVILICCVSMPAMAADPAMKFSAQITDFQGKPVQYCPKFKCTEESELMTWTVRDVIVAALMTQDPNETGIEQAHRSLLAERIYKDDGSPLDSKDLDTICDAVAKYVNGRQLPAIMTLQVWRLLDPARVDKAQKQ